MSETRSREERRAWWESLTAEEQAAQIRKWQLRKEQNPSRAALEASARLDIATERGVFMSAVSDADVAARLASTNDLATGPGATKGSSR